MSGMSLGRAKTPAARYARRSISAKLRLVEPKDAARAAFHTLLENLYFLHFADLCVFTQPGSKPEHLFWGPPSASAKCGHDPEGGLLFKFWHCLVVAGIGP